MRVELVGFVSRLRPLAACLLAVMSLAAIQADADPSPLNAAPRGPARPLRPAKQSPHRMPPWQAVPFRPATTIPVTSCADDGSAGTLRDVITGVIDGDVVDMTQLTCGTITLTTGQIIVAVNHLTLLGPGQNALVVDGDHQDRVLALYGGATDASIAISDLTIANGFRSGASLSSGGGGCIYASGTGPHSSLVLTRVTVTGCTAGDETATGYAVGGGIFTYGALTLVDSTISNNLATGPGDTQVEGGGAYATYRLAVSNSTIRGNSARRIGASGSGFVIGGAILTNVTDVSAAYIANSTISGNDADDFGGGIFLSPIRLGLPDVSFEISSSTVSGNTSGSGAGIEISTSPGANFTISVRNSTIAFNSITTMSGCGGLQQAGYVASIAELQSSIIAQNTVGDGSEYDACTNDADSSLVGANNLIQVSELTPPIDTINDDPLLGPLQDNGGATWTHALSSTSPAIDTGNDVAGFEFDQRGDGYARVAGLQSDIGAFEVQAGQDAIFASGFEASP